MATREEREKLFKPTQPKYTGFTPRPVERLATSRKPRSFLDLECSQFLRQGYEDSSEYGHGMLAYHLWLEAGKSEQLDPSGSDRSNSNSSVWRNFSQRYPLDRKECRNVVGHEIAAVYPVSIPTPSAMGDLTYTKFLLNSPIIKDKKVQKIAIKKAMQEYAEFQRLRLKSEMRHPPVNEQGHILPPSSMPKNLFHLAVDPIAIDSNHKVPDDHQLKDGTRVDMFGRQIPKTDYEQSRMWKLSYKLNNPEFDKMKGNPEFNKVKGIAMEQQKPATKMTFPVHTKT